MKNKDKKRKVIQITLVIIGILIIVAVIGIVKIHSMYNNVKKQVAQIEKMIGRSIQEVLGEGNKIEVFLKDTSDREMKQIGETLQKIEGVKIVQFKSKEDALNEMKAKFAGKEYLLSGYEENNILPSSYILFIEQGKNKDKIVNEIDKIENIKKVVKQDETVTSVAEIAKKADKMRVINIILIMIAGILVFAFVLLFINYCKKEKRSKNNS